MNFLKIQNLCKLNLNAFLFSDEKIDEEVLEMIDASHIDILLHKYPMGVQIRFSHNLEKWRRSIGKPLKATSFNEITTTHLNTKEIYGESPPPQFSLATTLPQEERDSQSSGVASLDDNISIISNPNYETISWKTSSENLSIYSGKSKETEAKKLKNKIDLEEILTNSPPNGPDLIEIYRKQKHFNHLDRKRLISTIVNYYLECKLPMDLKISYDLENAIIKMFPNENLRLYRTTKYGKIICRYNREMRKEKDYEEMREQGIKDGNEADMSMYLPNESFLMDEDDSEDPESIALINHE